MLGILTENRLLYSNFRCFSVILIFCVSICLMAIGRSQVFVIMLYTHLIHKVNKTVHKALSTWPERSLRSQWDNGQARHSLNLSLPFVVAYCLTEISAFSQAMWTKPNMDTQRKNTWETMSCLRFECSLWMPSGKRAYCRVGRGGWVALTLICWGFL